MENQDNQGTPDSHMEPQDEEKKDNPEQTPAEGEHQEEKPKGRPISDLINQELAATIKDMGFTKEVAEKALLYTNNASVEAAMDWITQHQDDPDFLEEELLAEDTCTDPNKPKLSKEERIKAAMELQAKIRAKREAEDKRLAEEAEKNRIQSTKELQKAKR